MADQAIREFEAQFKSLMVKVSNEIIAEFIKADRNVGRSFTSQVTKNGFTIIASETALDLLDLESGVLVNGLKGNHLISGKPYLYFKPTVPFVKKSKKGKAKLVSAPDLIRVLVVDHPGIKPRPSAKRAKAAIKVIEDELEKKVVNLVAEKIDDILLDF